MKHMNLMQKSSWQIFRISEKNSGDEAINSSDYIETRHHFDVFRENIRPCLLVDE